VRVGEVEREDPLGRKNKAMAKSKCRSAVRFVFFFGLLFLQVGVSECAFHQMTVDHHHLGNLQL
jgi:hypothetical protein